MHAEMALLAQQLRDIAVGVVDVAEMQRVGDAGIDAGRRGARIAAGRQAVLDARNRCGRSRRCISARRPIRRSSNLALASFCIAAAVGEVRFVHDEARLIGTGDVAIGAADADVVVDGDDAVGALARRGRGAHMHAGRVGAVLAADRHEGAVHIRKRCRPRRRAPCAIAPPARSRWRAGRRRCRSGSRRSARDRRASPSGSCARSSDPR